MSSKKRKKKRRKKEILSYLKKKKIKNCTLHKETAPFLFKYRYGTIPKSNNNRFYQLGWFGEVYFIYLVSYNFFL